MKIRKFLAGLLYHGILRGGPNAISNSNISSLGTEWNWVMGIFHQETSEEFDTVLLAIGRTGEAHKLGLADAGASRLQTEGPKGVAKLWSC